MTILLWKVCLGESGDAESASRKLCTLQGEDCPEEMLGKDAAGEGTRLEQGIQEGQEQRRRSSQLEGALTVTTETRRMYCRGRQYTVDEGVVRV